ncbi:hypothetical protein PULV_a2076 [Pseudoalteromonas ulvae UL12]|uniref:Mannose-1-phosphate guanylyltransferase n=1 Tax=Pseudoalteromonas ulvae TaxID=107327 RepID=A0A244CQJ1_PSEDV|nr:nucleotidyltransferase family protein [Pseudoalteromonas ulvae]MBE0365305.1 hypothetical protein [Pseudoalteromonas ulvae UL12]OUL57838.1 mannose-1-phosphate guanylyltransferase [Pseudoalteromonas ulvae]
MKAMILAAGRGKRMMPLTAEQPKPMLKVNDRPLLDYHLSCLKAAGVTDVVINLAWCGDVIRAFCQQGQKWGLDIQYSPEPPEGLETAGGIIQALPLLGEEPFIVINGDVFTDYDAHSLIQLQIDPGHAHLVLIENPEHNPSGDFSLSHGMVKSEGEVCHTFAGIAVYHPTFFTGLSAEFRPLAPLLREKMAHNQVTGELYLGQWVDVGTPERLAQLDASQRTLL